jgi:hypothetical protein
MKNLLKKLIFILFKMSNISSGSDDASLVSDSTNGEVKIEDLIESDPMYHTLAEFLLTSEDKSIANVLQDICNELKLIRVAMTKS